MTQKAQIVLRPGPLAEPAEHSGATRTLTAVDLGRLRDNTLAVMARGWRIPVFSRHAAAGSVDGGPQIASFRRIDGPAAGGPPDPVGHLVDLVQLLDGSLAQVIQLDEPFADAQFTSPELRSGWSDPNGNAYGPIIAHIALTKRPLSRGQTPLTPIDADASFSISPI